MKRVLLVFASCAVVAAVAYKFGGEKVRSAMNMVADAVMDVVGAW